MSASVQITVSDSLRTWVEEQMRVREFASIGEYVQHLLKEEQERVVRAAIDQKLLEALDSGDPIEVTPAFWEDLRREARQRPATHEAR